MKNLDVLVYYKSIIDKEKNTITAYFLCGLGSVTLNKTLKVTCPTSYVEQVNPENAIFELAEGANNVERLRYYPRSVINYKELLFNLIKLRAGVDYNYLCARLLENMDFALIKTSIGYKLFDKQTEEVIWRYDISNGYSLFDSLDVYLDDYIISPIEEINHTKIMSNTLHESFNELLKNKKFIVSEEAKYLDMICNYPSKVDVDVVYRIQMDDYNGYNRLMYKLLNLLDLILIRKTDKKGHICYGLKDINDNLVSLRMESYYDSQTMAERLKSLIASSIVSNIIENYNLNPNETDWKKTLMSAKRLAPADNNVKLLDFYLYHSDCVDLFKTYLIQKEHDTIEC